MAFLLCKLYSLGRTPLTTPLQLSVCLISPALYLFSFSFTRKCHNSVKSVTTSGSQTLSALLSTINNWDIKDFSFVIFLFLLMILYTFRQKKAFKFFQVLFCFILQATRWADTSFKKRNKTDICLSKNIIQFSQYRFLYSMKQKWTVIESWSCNIDEWDTGAPYRHPQAQLYIQ